jgi:rubredoxin
MSCPDCGAAKKQVYHSGRPAIWDEPQTFDYVECQVCGMCYAPDEAGHDYED